MLDKKLKPLTEDDMVNIKGGAVATFLVSSFIALLAIPVLKNLFNAEQGEVNLPGGFKTSWNNRDVTNVRNLEAKFNKLKNLYDDILPPFYEV